MLPLASEALYRISVKPCRKVDPGPSPLVCEIFADPELSKAVGFDHVTTAVLLILSVKVFIVLGQFKISGGSESGRR